MNSLSDLQGTVISYNFPISRKTCPAHSHPTDMALAELFIQNLTIHDFQTEGQNGALVMKPILWVAAILWIYIYKTGLSRKYQNVSHIVIITIFLEPCFCYMCLFTYVHKTVWFGLQYKNKFLTVSSWYGKNVSDWTALSFHLWFEKSLLPYVKFSQVNMPIQGSLFCS